jgi:hypothetical protein
MARSLDEVLAALRNEPAAGLDQRSRQTSPQYGLFLALACVIPLVTIFATHLWLRSAYTRDLFHLQGFLDQYGTSIYRYRLLGRDLLLDIYRLLARHHADQPFDMPTDRQATLLFYGAYVLLNAVFFFLSNLVLLLLLWDRKKGISDFHLAHYFFLVLLLALSTYAVTPYDQPAYFLMLLGFLAIRFSSPWLMYSLLGIAAVAGGLNRETEFLVTPALWTIALFASSLDSRRRCFRAGLFHLLLFAACYVALRLALPGVPAVAAGVTLGGKWALQTILVLCALFFIALALVTREYPGLRPSAALLILCAPYIVTILIGGELRELRLFIPLLLCLFFVYVQLSYLKNRASIV